MTKTYYVHPERGQPRNDGLSPERPFDNFDAALSRYARGDTIMLGTGRYPGKTITTPVKIKGWGKPVIDGSLGSGQGMLVKAPFTHLEGLDVRNVRREASIAFMGGAHHGTARDCTISDSPNTGLYATNKGADYLTWQNITVRNVNYGDTPGRSAVSVLSPTPVRGFPDRVARIRLLNIVVKDCGGGRETADKYAIIIDNNPERDFPHLVLIDGAGISSCAKGLLVFNVQKARVIGTVVEGCGTAGIWMRNSGGLVEDCSVIAPRGAYTYHAKGWRDDRPVTWRGNAARCADGGMGLGEGVPNTAAEGWR